MSEWQPIDTAPKDGQEIITTNFQGPGRYYSVDLTRWRPRNLHAMWLGRNDLPTYPTHWMTLPDPPGGSL